MNCYFCKRSALYSIVSCNHNCLTCALEYDLDDVYTSFAEEEVAYTHVYLTLNAKQYHIRWDLQANLTFVYIMEDGYSAYITSIPSLLSMNLSNIKDKIKIYLTFL